MQVGEQYFQMSPSISIGDNYGYVFLPRFDSAGSEFTAVDHIFVVDLRVLKIRRIL